MGYRKIKPRIVHIDSLMQECRLANGATNKNNGYGCISKSTSKAEPGACFAFDCPLAWVADLEDMEKHDSLLYEEYADKDYKPHEVGAKWVVQYLECV